MLSFGLSGLRRLNPGRSLAAILFYEFCFRVVELAFLVVYRLRREQVEPPPAEGALLIVANHQSFLDPPLVGLSIRNRHLTFLARSGLFKNPAFAWLLRALNGVPIQEGGRADVAAMRTAIEELRKGKVLTIFPEGARTSDGAMMPFKRGAWLLITKARCAVLPVAVEGCFDAWPRHKKWPSLWGKRVASKLGRVVPYEVLEAMGPEAGLEFLAREIDRMRLELRAGMRERTGGRYPPAGPGDVGKFVEEREGVGVSR